MSRCPLCFLQKTTPWYKDTPTHAILVCPICQGDMILMKNHEAGVDDRERMKALSDAYVGGEVELYETRCFANEHPHAHIRKAPKKKKGRKKSEVFESDHVDSFDDLAEDPIRADTEDME